MPAVTEQKKRGWSAREAYLIAILALALGTILGYLWHTPQSAASAPTKQAAASPHAAPQQQPVSPEALKQKADVEAQPLLAKLKTSPDDASTLTDVGNIYYRYRQFETSVGYYERAAKLNAGSARLLTDLGNAYYYAGNTPGALKEFDSALRVDPKVPDALFNRGILRWQAEGDVKAAIADWEKLLKTNPDHPKRQQVEKMIAEAKNHLNQPAGTPKPESPGKIVN